MMFYNSKLFRDGSMIDFVDIVDLDEINMLIRFVCKDSMSANFGGEKTIVKKNDRILIDVDDYKCFVKLNTLLSSNTNRWEVGIRKNNSKEELAQAKNFYESYSGYSEGTIEYYLVSSIKNVKRAMCKIVGDFLIEENHFELQSRFNNFSPKEKQIFLDEINILDEFRRLSEKDSGYEKFLKSFF